ncbi:FHA domain-containing protein [Hyalangium rubrum]|uniref:FHA domain-containing protein n=1 Tax=Hyalangium rubrum TaxID=3103134 RepID=A0ABU5H858_9BACT|nr:FHA domain-containing protein [Hyalangium sp. s54d21]MDY7229441.1 FHA domain-containing protein [Hyalangium sp. s54d21]
MAKGLQEGREISFEDDELTIGRTSENQVVLHDHGVSRRHARLFARGGRHYVTDLGSANGTLVNGKALLKLKEQELREGDRISLGGVEFVFSQLSPSPSPPPPEEATRMVPSRSIAPRSSTRITRANTEMEMQAIEAEDTGKHRIVSEAEVTGSASGSGAATLAEMPAVVAPAAGAATVAEMPAVLAPAAGTSTLAEMPATIRSSPPLIARPSPRTAAAKELGSAKPSAAERARERRQMRETLGGQLVVWWKELSTKGKSIAGVFTGLVVVGVMAVLFSVFKPAPDGRPKGPEPTQISISPLPDSFGLGEGVQWTNPDQKAFDFEFVSPTRAVAVLHYQASNISEQEVDITLNGVSQGWVPGDTATAAEREIELVLALSLLKRSERNQLAFDNVRNPPGQESWRVWNVYVEVIPVPELPLAELLTKAREQATAGERFYEQKDVGSENLFKAWKNYRSAWLTLEALEDKPDLYNDVRFALQQTSAELDQQCRKLMLDFQRSLQFRDGDKARATVLEVKRRFPTTEHRCHNLALEKAAQYELPLD